ncbi:hypothetical protein [Micromonospora eburnea]|uniref:Uncharacterized protein n=1 Tax=Micromonospora eburnea TaxID=227316 RepID=A0A1C6TQV3_9ACTN|nr:hypothetical protein [Micromonospora eburnea]SCL43804.1 hypothetical protein GA0070604_0015 [Micromonospora eburnea]SCL44019.1 hypothetical protein GA0070604_0147 [Micromonospora eburnea]
MSTLTAKERRWRAIDRKYARQERLNALRSSAEKMAMRLAASNYDNARHLGDDRDKSDRAFRAARRQTAALRRLLDALYAEAIR